MKIAIYPGSFDPLTNGHINIIKRSSNVFEQIIVAIAENNLKKSFFNVKKRIRLIQENVILLNLSNKIKVVSFKGLTAEYANKNGIKFIVRGLRAISDFEYEFKMAHMNKTISPNIETMFFMTDQKYFYTSSNLIKSIAILSPNKIKKFVPNNVFKSLKDHFKLKKKCN